jgi:zinc finger protein DZIP1
VGAQEQLQEARAEVTQLQKQLMKAMKATALAPMG